MPREDLEALEIRVEQEQRALKDSLALRGQVVLPDRLEILERLEEQVFQVHLVWLEPQGRLVSLVQPVYLALAVP